MRRIFTRTFLKFFLGFIAILLVSFTLIILAAAYKGTAS